MFGLFQLDLPLFGAKRPGQGTAATPDERRAIPLSGTLVQYAIRRSARRRTLGLTIDSRGLRVAAPLKARQSDIERLILDNARWVLAKLAEWQQPEHAAGRPWTPADPVPILGRLLPMKRAPGRPGLSVFDDMLILTVPDPDDESQVRLRLCEHLKEEARRDFLPRLARYCESFGVATPELRLNRAATRWGSCSRDRDGLHRVNLNWRMLHLAPHLIDYVVAHEVAHIRHMHHGPRFWAAVDTLYPGYEAARAQMRHVSARLPEI